MMILNYIALWFLILKPSFPLWHQPVCDIKPTPYLRTSRSYSLISQKITDSVVTRASRHDFNSRRKYAFTAEKLLRRNGLVNDKIMVAVLVNMWHESEWNPRNKDGSCVGLFQLHRKYTAKGMTMAQLIDVKTHVERLMSLAEYKKWKQWAIKNAERVSCGDLAYKFASDVERCQYKYRYPRLITANRWWKVYEKQQDYSAFSDLNQLLKMTGNFKHYN